MVEPTPSSAAAGTALDEIAQRIIFDAIRCAYDVGYNNSRHACAVPGDSAPGYVGKIIEGSHGQALIARLNKLLSHTLQTVAAQAPKAVAVPDERAEFEKWARQQPWIKDCQRDSEGVYGHYESQKAWATWKQARAALSATTTEVQAVIPRAKASVTLDYKQAYELLEMFGGEPCEITLLHAVGGHSGDGLYAVYTDLPGEGATYLGQSDDEATPDAKAEVQAEPVMIYHGRCTIDCGAHGHHDVEMLKMIPAGAKLYTAPQAQPADALDAARWRALLACGRIRIIGTAGVNGSGIHDPSRLGTYNNPYGNYVHFGAEFWSTFPDQDYYNTKGNPAYARATLTEFADACRAAMAAAQEGGKA